MHLDGNEREIMRERMSRRNEIGTLFNGGTAGSLVSFGYDNGEIFRTEEGRDGDLDTVKARFEPLRGLGEMREI